MSKQVKLTKAEEEAVYRIVDGHSLDDGQMAELRLMMKSVLQSMKHYKNGELTQAQACMRLAASWGYDAHNK